VAVGLIFAVVSVVAGIIFGQPWREAMGTGFFVLVIAMSVLFGRNLLRARQGIERESNEQLAAWRAQFATEINGDPRGWLVILLWAPRGSFPTAFMVTVDDPLGGSASAPHSSLAMGDLGRMGDALSWEYPVDFGTSMSELVDGPYTVTWFASGHVKPIAEQVIERLRGQSSVQEPSDV
jgi:hypothetical protein